MIRDMKWHIYNQDKEPLCFGYKVLEFDSQNAALDFIAQVQDLSKITDRIEGFSKFDVIYDILYYDGGYMNATNLQCTFNSDTNTIILTEKDLF